MTFPDFLIRLHPFGTILLVKHRPLAFLHGLVSLHFGLKHLQLVFLGRNNHGIVSRFHHSVLLKAFSQFLKKFCILFFSTLSLGAWALGTLGFGSLGSMGSLGCASSIGMYHLLVKSGQVWDALG